MAQFFLFVNGRKVSPPFSPRSTLASFLRDHLRLSGCKVACGQGMCGACTVLLSHFDPRAARIIHTAINACHTPLAACHAKAVITVEGLGSARGRLQPLQTALAAGHGVQCGFCSPGFVMSAYALLRSAEEAGRAVTAAEVETALRGNLCRCTGYRPILQALKKACCDGGNGSDCCKGGGTEKVESVIDETQELLFPPALRVSSAQSGKVLRFKADGVEWIEAAEWDGALAALKESPTAAVIGGNGMLSLQEQLRKTSTVLVIRNATEFSWNKEKKQLKLDSGLTLANLELLTKKIITETAADGSLLHNFGKAALSILESHTSPQVKNMATVGGSLAAYRFYPYLPTLLSATDAVMSVFDRSTLTMKDMSIADYLKGSQSELQRFVIKSVLVSLDASPGTSLRFLKLQQHPRFKFCLALLHRSAAGQEFKATAAQCSSEDPDDGYRISTIEANDCDTLLKRLVSGDENCGASRRYFNAVASSWVNRFLLGSSDNNLCPLELSGGEQTFDTNLTSDTIVGRPLLSSYALEATSGEAEYLDDVTPMKNELHLVLVSSTFARAKLLRIDAKEALAVPGVVDFLTAKDVPCNNFFNYHPVADEEVFAQSEVQFVGQPIGAVLADDLETARRAAELVQVEYQPLEPVLTLEQAMAAEKLGTNCFDPELRSVLTKGNTTDSLSQEEEARTVRGAITLEAQEHFYMEPQSALVYPSKEKDRMVIYTSSHAPFLVTNVVSHVLKLPSNLIESRVFRIGGSFGGKESCHLITCLPAAVAAYKHRRPCRCILSRREDFRSTGCRHPMKGEFEAMIAPDLSIARMKLDMKAEGGYAIGLSAFLPNQVCLKAQSAYHMPNFRCEGKAYKTNTSSNTAMRGFCHPETTFALEMAIELAAESLGICPDALRERNLLRPGHLDAFKNEFTEDALLRCWHSCRERANFEARKASVAEFNSKHKEMKKGISLIPTLMPISFDVAFLNHGMAVMNVEAIDGHISLIHSGIEIGQGIEIKMMQVAAQALGLPVELFHTPRFSSTHLPNSSPTSGSGTSDRIGNAVLVACEEVKKRLEWKPLDGEQMSDRVGRWKKTVFGAYFRQTNLSFQGFYALPGPGFDPSTMTGLPGFHYSFGVACTEVALDGGTGEYRLLRTDIVMDLGRSLNPCIDIGQIEGAFMQGVGLFCCERLSRNEKTGDFPQHIVLDYGVPRAYDIPASFNVHLLENSVNAKPSAVFSSKGIGEPPLALGSSAYFAMRRAVAAFAADGKPAPRPVIPCPATPDRVKAAIDALRLIV